MKSLGQAGVIEPETEAMLMEYDVDYSEFTDEVLACLPQGRPWTIPPEELKRRRDLRYHQEHGEQMQITSHHPTLQRNYSFILVIIVTLQEGVHIYD